MGGSDLIVMARDTNECLAVVNAVMKLAGSKECAEFLEWIRDRLKRGQSSVNLMSIE